MSYDLSNMVEVELKQSDDFLKVKETLTRIGVASRKEKDTLPVLTIYYINEVNTISFTSKNYSYLMGRIVL